MKGHIIMLVRCNYICSIYSLFIFMLLRRSTIDGENSYTTKFLYNSPYLL